MFTSKKAEEVEEYFNKYNRAAFARAGDLSNATVLVKKGNFRNFAKKTFLEKF